MTSGETHFFRHPDQFRMVSRQLVPAMREGPVRIWSAGCSLGAEPYSLALELHEHCPDSLPRVQLFASDANSELLRQARRAVYPNWLLRELPPGLQARYFRRQGETYVLDPEIAQTVDFFLHDLRQGPLGQECDIIFCRNVLIYYLEDEALPMLRNLAASLAPGGYLFLGYTEATQAAVRRLEEMKLADPSLALYRKQPRPRPAEQREEARVARPSPPPESRPTDCALQELRSATLALEKNAWEEAQVGLRRCLYLDPQLAAAHFQAGCLALASGRRREAARSFRNAVRYSELGPPDTPARGWESLTNDQLRQLALARWRSIDGQV